MLSGIESFPLCYRAHIFALTSFHISANCAFAFSVINACVKVVDETVLVQCGYLTGLVFIQISHNQSYVVKSFQKSFNSSLIDKTHNQSFILQQIGIKLIHNFNIENGLNFIFMVPHESNFMLHLNSVEIFFKIRFNFACGTSTHLINLQFNQLQIPY